LADHIFSNPGEVPGDTLDNDNNGKIDDIRGWDFVNEDNDPMDIFPYHGTAVAGIVAGDGTGGQSTGIAPDATILPIRASGGQWSDIFEALDYAVDMDVDVIQMSVSQKWQGSPKPDYAAWRTAVENELALGYVHSNSIGNQGASLHTDPVPFNISAPGNCPSPWLSHFQFSAGGQTSVISVGAITSFDIADEASSRGPSEWNDIAARQPEYPYPMPPSYQDYPYWGDNPGLLKPDLCAPGPGAMSLDDGSGYRTFSGTSAATPHVAGAMALLLQANPSLSPETLDMVLQTTAVDLGVSGKDTVYGAGRLDCYAALLKVQQLHTYSYLQGTVRNAVTLDTIPRAQVTISTLPATKIAANSIGGYRLHVRQGLFTVIASAFGYEADTIAVTVPGDTIIERDFALQPILTGTLTGTCTSSLGDTLADVRVRIKEAPYASQTTGPLGNYVITDVPIGVPLTLEAVKFNHAVVLTPVLLDSTVVDTIDVALPYGLHDDFELDQGWTRSLDDEAAYGLWERGDPNATFFGATMVQPEDDASATGTQCYLTGNSIVGASQSYNDVTGGATTLLSPLFDATVYHNPVLNYSRWFSMDTGTTDTDSLLVSLSNDGGQSWTDLEVINTSDRNWTARSYEIATYLTVSDSMQIRVRAADNGGPSVVEAAVDEFLITENTSDVVEDPGAAGLAPSFHLAQAAPNPFRMGTGAAIRFALPISAPTKLSVYDIQGRRVVDLLDGTLTAGAYVATWDGRDRAGRRCGAGLYLYRLTQGRRTDEGRVILMR
ncbi:MAG: S8 family serine peptidase, partial [Candidatus Eisenbacteria bacterium]|nr:S8 family serine peptidase [Candidatus Eisenbacteria bacterium]